MSPTWMSLLSPLGVIAADFWTATAGDAVMLWTVTELVADTGCPLGPAADAVAVSVTVPFVLAGTV